MRQIKKKLIALTTMATLCTAGTSHGYLYATTTTGGVVVVGAVVLVVVLMGRKNGNESEEDGKVKAEAAKAAQLYLRDSHLQLAQDLALGEGPVLDELAAGAHVSPENRPAFDALMQAHADELIKLSDPATLDEARTLRFAERYVEILRSDAALAEDLATVG